MRDWDLNLQQAAAVALDAAREAAELLREGFRRKVHTTEKNGNELVTEYDGRAEELLTARIAKAFPEHAIVGEEASAHQPVDRSNVSALVADDQPVWYIDPLDGTVNFAHHLPWYAISIGLELDGQPLVGIVVAPETHWEVAAIAGGGVSLNGSAVRVSETATLGDALVATGFPYDRQGFDNVLQLQAALRGCRGVRRMGTASLDCLAVACGWLDGYWEFRLRPWDVSAGALLVKEAGGHVTAVDGRAFVSTDGQILATNGRIHRALSNSLAAIPPPPECT